MMSSILQHSDSLGTISLAINVVADVAPPHERGTYIGAALCKPSDCTCSCTLTYHQRPNTAPSLGPVLGGLLTQQASWRWIFWFLGILSALCIFMIAVCLPETGRTIVGNGSIPARGINRSLLFCIRQTPADSGGGVDTASTKPAFRIPNPTTCLQIVFHKDTALVLFANAVFYMTYSCIQACLSPLLMELYGLDALKVGLTYLPYGIGCGVASYTTGDISVHLFFISLPHL